MYADEDDNDFDFGHVCQSSCNSEMKQGLTSTDTGNADVFDLVDKGNSNIST